MAYSQERFQPRDFQNNSFWRFIYIGILFGNSFCRLLHAYRRFVQKFLPRIHPWNIWGLYMLISIGFLSWYILIYNSRDVAFSSHHSFSSHSHTRLCFIYPSSEREIPRTRKSQRNPLREFLKESWREFLKKSLESTLGRIPRESS